MMPKIILYGLVRDENGVPKFDDPANAPDGVKAMLTANDIALLSDETLAALNMTRDSKGTE
jgi:hypothetical protein